uniref:Signal peptidase I n=1 Tax=Desulfobacca acetoxidans TaxID=60893 RepID=A0A7V4G8H2_9BACT
MSFWKKTPGAAPAQGAQKKKSKWQEYGESLFIALALALVIRAFLVQAFSIPSGSMEPTLLIGDYLLVNKLAYGVRNPFTNKIWISWGVPQRGDVVVFIFTTDSGKPYIKQPEDSPYRDDRQYREEKDYIKRVIGLPGDRIQIVNKKVFINGEPYVTPQAVNKHDEIIPAGDQPRDNFGPVTVPPGHYFVMGDNRDHSLDSRFWGFVSLEAMRGRAFIIYFSWNAQPGETLLPALFDGFRGLVTNFSWDSSKFSVRWSRLGKLIH